MKFVLEVDMDGEPFEKNAARELGRILRYWGGNLHHYRLVPGDGSVIYDSNYTEVGRWSITGAAPDLAADPGPHSDARPGS